uniref:Pectin acetylesterase n=1 Tax=Aegilops tauschii subsp. strangulata TaxID=200361 RepID=A0A453GX65_AEGTS
MSIHTLHLRHPLRNVPFKPADFYNWNKVKVRYCDGASFSGNVEEEFQEDGTPFFFRGQRIWEAVMSELLSKGLSRAKEAFLTGCSAGGLSTYIHCDDFRALVPKASTVKCLADGGFFLDVEDISGRRYMRGFYNDVARLQRTCGKNLLIAVQIWSRDSAFFHGKLQKASTPQCSFSIQHMMFGRWSTSCLQKDPTLNTCGKIAGWILLSVIPNSSKLSKVSGKSCLML